MRAEHSGVDAAPPERTRAQSRAFPGGPSASPDCTGRTVQGCHDTWLTAQGADVRLLAMSTCPGPRPPARATATARGHGHLPGATSTARGHVHLPGAMATAQGTAPCRRPCQSSVRQKCLQRQRSPRIWQKWSGTAPGCQDGVSGLLVETNHH